MQEFRNFTFHYIHVRKHVRNGKNQPRKRKIWNVGNSGASLGEIAAQTNSYTSVQFEQEDGQLQEVGLCETGGN